jgi:hypothetical protein
MDSPDAVSPDTHGSDAPVKPAAFNNASDLPPDWSVPWPDPPSPEDERFDRMVGILTAAGALAGVSLLAVWLWGPGPTERGHDATSASARRNPAARQTNPAAPAIVGTAGSAPETADPRMRLAPPYGTPAAVLARDTERRRRPSTDDAPVSTAYDPRPAVQGRTGGLLVLSQPLGARVTINGVGYGTTPTRIPYLPPGPKRIRVTMDGYDTEERFFGPETSMSAATLRIVMRQTPLNSRTTDSVRDLEPSDRPR